jgi:hypothetical protein
MESLHFVQHSLVDPKTPNFIKSLFDEDSGLGMDFDDVTTLDCRKTTFFNTVSGQDATFY